MVKRLGLLAMLLCVGMWMIAGSAIANTASASVSASGSPVQGVRDGSDRGDRGRACAVGVRDRGGSAGIVENRVGVVEEHDRQPLAGRGRRGVLDVPVVAGIGEPEAARPAAVIVERDRDRVVTRRQRAAEYWRFVRPPSVYPAVVGTPSIRRRGRRGPRCAGSGHRCHCAEPRGPAGKSTRGGPCS